MSGRRPFSIIRFLFCLAFMAPGLIIASQYDPPHFVVFLIAVAGALVGAGVHHLAQPLWAPRNADTSDR